MASTQLTSPEKYQHLIAGTAGGFVSTALLYPLELIKTRMQVVELSQNNMYRSVFSSYRAIVSLEGIGGFYKGITPALIATSCSWGGYFYFYENSKNRKLLNKYNNINPINQTKSNINYNKLNTVDHLLSGIEAGVILVLLFNPLWVIKTRLALQDSQHNKSKIHHYNGVIDALKVMYKEEGWTGFYKGLIPSLILTSHGAIQFASYEFLKAEINLYRIPLDPLDNIKATEINQPAFVSVFIGGLSKVIASTITYPYQVIKSRLQQREIFDQITQKFIPVYKNSFDCAYRIWKYEGIRGYFRGIIPNALKVAPSAALTFMVYEECIKLLR
eukprot:gene6268-8632_t